MNNPKHPKKFKSYKISKMYESEKEEDSIK